MTARAMLVPVLFLFLTLPVSAAGRNQSDIDFTQAGVTPSNTAMTPQFRPIGEDELILAVAWSPENSPVYRIHEPTGKFEMIGHSGFRYLNSMARDRSGAFYSVESFQGNVATLITIDPATGAGMPVVMLHLPGAGRIDVRALAFSSTDTLYAILNDPFTFRRPRNCCLYTIDTSTGLLSPVGELGYKRIQSLAFSPSGVLYGWDVDVGLVTIDPATGATTDVNHAMDGDLPGPLNNNIQSLAFNPDGRLIGRSGDGADYRGYLNEVREIDPLTGSSTVLSSTTMAHSVRGIEYLVPPPLPVAIDVKPGNPANDVNPGSRGVVRVALLGEDGFDVEQVDAATLTLGPDEAPTSHTHTVRVHDVNHDGRPDLDLHFRIDETGLSCDDSSVTLRGRLENGRQFEGADAINSLCRPWKD